MPLHHYMPATFLSSFSSDNTTLPRRNRKVFVGDKQKKIVFEASVSKVAAINNFYTTFLDKEFPDAIEKNWSGYETNLNEAIEQLINKSISAKSWIRTVIPFITGMFVRGPDYDHRLKNRFESIDPEFAKEYSTSDNTNIGRLLEFQRLLSSITLGRWEIVESNILNHFITNDLGYTRFQNIKTNESGVSIPLNMNYILMISPRNKGCILKSENNCWYPNIIYREMFSVQGMQVNQILTNNAQRYIFGHDKKVIQELIDNSITSTVALEPHKLGFLNSLQSEFCEYTWDRLACLVEDKPNEILNWTFQIDYDKLYSGWVPLPLLTINKVEYPIILYKSNTQINFYLYSEKIINEIHEFLFLEQNNRHDEIIQRITSALQTKQRIHIKNFYLTLRGNAYFGKKLYHKALSDYKLILQTDPNIIIVRSNIVAAYCKLNKLSIAEQEAEIALKLNPNNFSIQYNLVLTYLSNNDPFKALNQIKIALQDETLTQNQKCKLLEFRGICNSSLSKYETALEDFRQIESSTNDQDQQERINKLIDDISNKINENLA